MTNNDILRRIRYAFDFNDTQMMTLFELGGLEVLAPLRPALDLALTFEDGEALALMPFVVELR